MTRLTLLKGGGGGWGLPPSLRGPVYAARTRGK